MIALVFEPMPTARQASQRSQSMRTDAQRLIDGAIAMAASFADGRRENVAVKLREAADATYDFGQSLDDLPHMRGYVEEAAHALAGLSDYVRTSISPIWSMTCSRLPAAVPHWRLAPRCWQALRRAALSNRTG